MRCLGRGLSTLLRHSYAMARPSRAVILCIAACMTACVPYAPLPDTRPVPKNQVVRVWLKDGVHYDWHHVTITSDSIFGEPVDPKSKERGRRGLALAQIDSLRVPAPTTAENVASGLALAFIFGLSLWAFVHLKS